MSELNDNVIQYQTRVVLSVQEQAALELGRRILAHPEPGFALEHDLDDPVWWLARTPDAREGYLDWRYGHGADPLEALRELDKEAE